MTMQLINPMAYPAILPETNSRTPANNSFAAMNSAGVKRAGCIQAPKTGNIHKISFRTGTVTSSGDCDVRLETIDTSTGFPSGTLVGTNTNKVVTLTTSNAVVTVTLTADAAVTKGQFIALVFAYSTGNYTVQGLDSVMYLTNFPRGGTFNATTWANNTFLPYIDLEYDDGSRSYILGALPVTTSNNYAAMNSGTTPDERAMGVVLPFTAQVTGAWLYLTGSGDFDVVLYDTDGSTVLASVSMDKDYFGQVAAAGLAFVAFTATATIIAGGLYYLAIKPTTVTSIGTFYMDAMSSSFLAAMPWGVAVDYSRTDAGAWSINSATRQPLWGLLLSGIDTGISLAQVVNQ